MTLPHAEDFFRYARARQTVLINRRKGAPKPWTSDPILQRYRFTNIFREDDKTTVWFRNNVRDRYRDSPGEVLVATVLFRWFNTIRSGESMFMQRELFSHGMTAFEMFLDSGNIDPLRSCLRKQGAPWVTGAYMIRSPDGMDKLDGILECFRRFAESDWRGAADRFHTANVNGTGTLKSAWEYLRGFYGLGRFLAYELVTDLRWTCLLDKSNDIMTWANPGPGALRGAHRLLAKSTIGRKGRASKAPYDVACSVMQELLELSRSEQYWPQYELVSAEMSAEVAGGPVDYTFENRHFTGDLWHWPSWELREVEHTLCEFDKYERTRLGQGRPRGTFE